MIIQKDGRGGALGTYTVIAEQQQGPSEGRDHEFKMRTVGMVALLFFSFLAAMFSSLMQARVKSELDLITL